ncbi:hypothetical protein ACFO4O_01590 [Glaciecola siphonariae]|uniref:Uncharacterized protein n=1 Tax=Glaciecola siphonariae TaxID=521012 RepID=A0ABV9LTM1_9ALTE
MTSSNEVTSNAPAKSNRPCTDGVLTVTASVVVFTMALLILASPVKASIPIDNIEQSPAISNFLFGAKPLTQAGLGITSRNPIDAHLHSASMAFGTMLNDTFNDNKIGFRWGLSNEQIQGADNTYSVLFGYVQANKIELNVGFLSLSDDQRIIAHEVYEGTWYAGFSAKF